ncbi:hypothetical protein IWX50DRAFT_676883 [Phyllosticta citricarpa]|uniref:Uncharacterized protein n=1 Tax=Phyllosticta citricarpa TaxID=55181 RepID=A0ABR1MKZ7_9PEZI
MNLHFKNVSEESIDPSTTSERHEESNIQHEYFIGFYKDLRNMLVTKPADSTNVPIDPEKARIAGRMRSVLKNMHTMTDDVMNAWKEYRSKRLSLSQTTLITHAAVERAQALERYPVCFQHVMSDTFQGELSDVEKASREAKLKLKSRHKDQALSEVIENPGKIAMIKSFAIQLLAKISLGFKEGSHGPIDYHELSFGKEIGKKVLKRPRPEIDRDTLRDQHEPLRLRIYTSCWTGSHIWAHKSNVLNWPHNSTCGFGDDACLFITMKDDKGRIIRNYRRSYDEAGSTCRKFVGNRLAR